MSVNGEEEGRTTANESGGGMGTGARIAIGATVLAAGLGVGAFVITDRLTEKPAERAEVGALAPAVAESTPEELPSTAAAPASTAVPESAKPQASVSTSMPSVSAEVRKQIMEAREKGAKEGVKITRALPDAAPKPVKDLKMTETGSFKEGGTVRVVSARGDLTGQEELAWVAGGIAKYRGVDCSQTFKLFNSPKPHKKPNLLVCWRTSLEKSVIAVVVDAKGKPSKEKAVTELEKRWRSM